MTPKYHWVMLPHGDPALIAPDGVRQVNDSVAELNRLRELLSLASAELVRHHITTNLPLVLERSPMANTELDKLCERLLAECPEVA